MLESDTGIRCGELPIGLGMVGVSIVLPSCDFVDEGLFIWDAAIEALRRKDAEFGFRHIEPTAVLWSVTPFEPLDEPPCFGGGKSFVERGWLVSVEIVLHENDFPGIRKVSI